METYHSGPYRAAPRAGQLEDVPALNAVLGNITVTNNQVTDEQLFTA